MGSLTEKTPKPMLPLQGRPLLEHNLLYLAGQGIHEIGINLHHRPEIIQDVLEDGSRLGVRLQYTREPRLLGTAGALTGFADWLAGEPSFLVLYGDILTDQDLSGLWESQRTTGALAALLLHPRRGSNSMVQMDEARQIRKFIERPENPDRFGGDYPWANSGVQVLDSRILGRLETDRPMDLPRDIYAPLAGKELLVGVPLSGYRCAIDSPERYRAAEAAVRDGRYRPAHVKVDS